MPLEISDIDARFLASWPSLYTKIFIAVEFILTIVTAYSTYVMKPIIFSLAGGIATSVISFVLLVVILFKDSCGSQNTQILF